MYKNIKKTTLIIIEIENLFFSRGPPPGPGALRGQVGEDDRSRGETGDAAFGFGGVFLFFFSSKPGFCKVLVSFFEVF